MNVEGREEEGTRKKERTLHYSVPDLVFELVDAYVTVVGAQAGVVHHSAYSEVGSISDLSLGQPVA